MTTIKQLIFRSEKGEFSAETQREAKDILKFLSYDEESFPLEILFVDGSLATLRADIPIPSLAEDYLSDKGAMASLASGLSL